MSYYQTGDDRDYIFGKDGGKQLAANLNTNFLGEIPLMKTLREGSDNGKPVSIHGSPEQIELFNTIASNIERLRP